MSMRLKTSCALLCVFGGFFVAGCQPVKPNIKVSYQLNDYHTANDSLPGNSKDVLYVPMPYPDVGLGTRAMRYMVQPYQMESFAHHRWEAPPTEMLLPRLVSAIARKHHFKAVVSAPFAGYSSYELSTKLLSWHEAFYYPKPRIQLALEVTLLNSRTHQVVATRTFHVSQEVSDRQIYTAVIATDAAVSRLENKVADFVVKAAS